MWSIIGTQEQAGTNDVYRVDIDINNEFTDMRICCAQYRNPNNGKIYYRICLDGKQQSSWGSMQYRCYTPSGNYTKTPSYIVIDEIYNVGAFGIEVQSSDSYAGVVGVTENPLQIVYTSTTNVSDMISHANEYARTYFDSLPSHGQGTVTLDIPANGANLTFESALLGVSITKMISKDDVVNIEGAPAVPTVYQDTAMPTINGAPSWMQIANLALIQEATARIICTRFSMANQTNKSLSVQGASGGACRLFPSYGIFGSVVGILAESNTSATAGFYVDAGGNYYDNAVISLNYTCISIPNTIRLNPSQSSTTTTSLTKKLELTLNVGTYIITSRYAVNRGQSTAYSCLKAENDVLCAMSNNGAQTSAWPYIYCSTVISCQQATTISSWGQNISSGYSDETNIYAVAVSGNVLQNTFTTTSSTTLSTVCSITLSKGQYLIVSQLDFAYSNSNVEYYQKVSYGNETIIEESGVSYSGQPTASNSMQYVSVSSSTTISMQAKMSVSGIGISGHIKALKID